MAKTWPNSTCWTSNDALAMVNIEAGTPDDAKDANRGDHVFLASHQAPLVRALTEEDFTNDRPGASTSQGQVLTRIEDRSRPMLFVTGAPGTGKSHIVRWLHIHATAEAAASKHKKDLFAHVPRSMTNLADVLQVILEHADEDDREDIRQKISKATGEAKSDQALRDRLLLTLSTRLSELREEVVREGASHQFGKRGYHEVLDRLPDFLASGEARALYRRDGGPADRIVRVRLQERKETDDVADMQLRFTRDDILAGGDLAELEDARFGKSNLQCRARLLSEEDFLVRSLELIDYCVDGAVRELVGLDASQLQHAMSRLLTSLADRGQRLVLFFEDWGLIAGFQNQLAEAFAAAKGESVLAVIAITSQRLGQFQGNILQRGWIYSLNRTADENLTEAVNDLLARNLNAIRLGPKRLRGMFEGRSDGAWLTSACDECPLDVKSTCHESFGSIKVDGVGEVGLYPMTHESIGAALRRKSPGSAYVPRIVLSEILRVVLGHETVDELAAASFPSQQFAEEFAPTDFRLEPVQRGLVERALRSSSAAEQTERWVAFLETYRSRVDLRTHSAGAAAALGLQPIEDIAPLDLDLLDEPLEPPSKKKDNAAPNSPEPTAIGQQTLKPSPTMDGALAFKQGRQIASEDALRKVAADAIRSAIKLDGRLNDDAWKDSPDGFHGNDIGLGSPSRSSRPFEVVLDGTANGDVLIGLVHLNDGGSWSQLDLSRDRRLNTEQNIDAWAHVVQRELIGERHRYDVAALLRLLIITVMAWGVAARVDERNALNVALASPPKTTGLNVDSLRDAKVREAAQEMLLRRVAFSQGRGAPVALDIAMLAPIVGEVLKDLRLPTADELPRTTPDGIVGAVDRMEEDLVQRTKGLASYLHTWWTVNGEDALHLEEFSTLRDAEERLSSQLPLHPAGQSAEVKAALKMIRELRVEVGQLLSAARIAGLEQLISAIPDHVEDLENRSTAEQLALSIEFDSIRSLMSALQRYLLAVRTIADAVAGRPGPASTKGTASSEPRVPSPPTERAEALAKWAAKHGQKKGVRRGK